MAGFSTEEEERKKAIFDSMSAKGRKRILDKGYEKWDPFLSPKDPLDSRMAGFREAASSLVQRFLQTCPPENCSDAYRQGAWEACMGLISGDDRWRGIYEFSYWRHDLLKKEEGNIRSKDPGV